MTPPIRVCVVDDDMFVRQALGGYVEAHPDFALVGRCAHGGEAVALAEAQTVDVFLMDVQMPVMDGITATRTITAGRPTTRVLLMTSFDDDRAVQAGLDSGASGFLLKSSTPETLLLALRAVHAGTYVLSPEPARRMTRPPAPAPEHPPIALSASELEVLALVCEGRSNPAIAAQLFMSESTVKLRLSSIEQKLGTNSRVSTAIRAFELGLLTRSDTRSPHDDRSAQSS